MWLHACTRCGGDLYVRDYGDEAMRAGDTREVVCLQCGGIHTPQQVAAVVRSGSVEERQARAERRAA